MIKYNRSVVGTVGKSEQTGANKIKIVGVGGAGANVLDRLSFIEPHQVELIAVDTDLRCLNSSVSQLKLQIGKSLTQGLGTGGDPELGKQAALQSVSEITESLQGAGMIFIVGGLGGGASSGATPCVAEIAKGTGAFVVSVAMMPFRFEGDRRSQQALQALERLRHHTDALLTFENDKMGELILARDGIQQAFTAAEKLICQSIDAIVKFSTGSGGLVDVSIADVLAVLRGQDSRCLFGAGLAEGKNRSLSALKMALKSPLLDQGDMLENTQNLLAHIFGGESTTLYEVEMLMKELQKHVSPKAQIFLGISISSRYKDNLGVTLLSSINANELYKEEKVGVSNITPSITSRSEIKEEDHSQKDSEKLAKLASDVFNPKIAVESKTQLTQADEKGDADEKIEDQTVERNKVELKPKTSTLTESLQSEEITKENIDEKSTDEAKVKKELEEKVIDNRQKYYQEKQNIGDKKEVEDKSEQENESKKDDTTLQKEQKTEDESSNVREELGKEEEKSKADAHQEVPTSTKIEKDPVIHKVTLDSKAEKTAMSKPSSDELHIDETEDFELEDEKGDKLGEENLDVPTFLRIKQEK